MNNDKCRCKCQNPKEYNVCEKKKNCNPATCSCKNGKYLGSIIDDLAVICDEIIDSTKTVPKETVPTRSTSTIFYNLLVFLLITIILLRAVSIS